MSVYFYVLRLTYNCTGPCELCGKQPALASLKADVCKNSREQLGEMPRCQRFFYE